MNDKEQIAMLRGTLEYCSENMENQTNAEIEMFQQALASVVPDSGCTYCNAGKYKLLRVNADYRTNTIDGEYEEIPCSACNAKSVPDSGKVVVDEEIINNLIDFLEVPSECGCKESCCKICDKEESLRYSLYQKLKEAVKGK